MAQTIRRFAAAFSFLFASYSTAQASERVRTDLERTLRDLGRVVVHENIVRYAAKGARIRQLDVLDRMAEFIGGTEHYQQIFRNGRPEGFAEVQSTGIWTFGEMATVVRSTRDVLVQQTGPDFHFEAASRRWYVVVDSQVYWLGATGNIIVRPKTGELARISWVSDSIAPGSGLSRVEWTVDFREMEVAGERYTLPSTATYRLVRLDRARTEWNVTTFSDYARYGSTADLITVDPLPPH